MRPLRISAISFLNTVPLMWDFEHNPSEELKRNFRIEYTVPSQCAAQLKEGAADIGIVPVITTATIPDLVIIPNISIAADGPVRSILLVSKVPIEDIKTVAADTSSRTSVALTQVLLANFYGGPRKLIPMAPELGPMLKACDAALLIGDPALTAKTTGYHVYDLAEIWKQKQGMPFVFAVWAIRKQALAEADPALDIVPIFQRSRDHGLLPQSIATIAREWAPRLSLSEPDVASYLEHNIYYQLDERCMSGLRAFFLSAEQLGLIPLLRFPELLPPRTSTAAK